MTFELTWRVYKVLDATTNEPIYIGCTMDPHTRRHAHTKSGPVCKWMQKTGREFHFVIVDKFSDHQAAIALEAELINSTSGLLNRSTRAGNIPLELRATRGPKPWEVAGVSRATWYRQQRRLVSQTEGETR
jgi:predicted GIY-YIG superfamily endonuclease